MKKNIRRKTRGQHFANIRDSNERGGKLRAEKKLGNIKLYPRHGGSEEVENGLVTTKLVYEESSRENFMHVFTIKPMKIWYGGYTLEVQLKGMGSKHSKSRVGGKR